MKNKNKPDQVASKKFLQSQPLRSQAELLKLLTIEDEEARRRDQRVRNLARKCKRQGERVHCSCTSATEPPSAAMPESST